MLNTKLVTWSLGIWTSITFLVCVLYGLVTPQSLHMGELLEQFLPAFRWLTWWGFLLGLVPFIWGSLGAQRAFGDYEEGQLPPGYKESMPAWFGGELPLRHLRWLSVLPDL